MTQDEACAMVYNYLQGKATAMTHFTFRQQQLGVLDSARPHFEASYQGKGKWQVLAVGIGGYTNINDICSGLWNVYEASEVIEPANDPATMLLSYIHRWTLIR